MEVGDRVKMNLGGNYGETTGTIIKITKDGFTVVSWDGINGDWYWTEKQTEQMEVINEDR